MQSTSPKKRLRGAMLAATVAVCATAPAAGHAFVVTGEGTKSCREWLANRENPYGLAMFSWVLGFMSHAAMESEGGHLMDGVGANDLRGGLERYCRENPDRALYQGAQRLAAELQQRLERSPQ